jgi:hypothetical protein
MTSTANGQGSGPHELDLDGLDALASLDERLRGVAADLTALDAVLAEHIRDCEALAAARPVRAWWWPDLDTDQAETAWTTLSTWVDATLLARQPSYEVDATGLRPCWRRHPDVVDELTALYAAWHEAYRAPNAKPTAALDYLARLPAVMARIHAMFTASGCKLDRAAEHHDNAAKYPGPAHWDPDQLATFITEDARGRRLPN